MASSWVAMSVVYLVVYLAGAMAALKVAMMVELTVFYLDEMTAFRSGFA